MKPKRSTSVCSNISSTVFGVFVFAAGVKNLEAKTQISPHSPAEYKTIKIASCVLALMY